MQSSILRVAILSLAAVVAGSLPAGAEKAAPQKAKGPVLTTKLKVKVPKLAKLRKATVTPLRVSTAQRLPVAGRANGTTLSRTLQRSKRDASAATDVADEAGAGRFCTERVVSEAAGEYTKIVLGNQSDKIYPGAIYGANAVLDGSYLVPAGLERRPYEIATSLYSAASTGSSFVEVQPSLGGVNDGIAELMRRNRQVVNASSVSTEVSQIYSVDQLAFELQAGYQGYGVDLAAEFAYSRDQRKRVIFAKLTQVYFSVALNRPSGAALVGNNVRNLPANIVYVNKVNYGRLGILKIETDYSAEQIEAALEFRYAQGNQSAHADASLDYAKILDQSKVTGFFFGGDATNGIVTLTDTRQLDEFDAYARNGLRLDTLVAPTPISYELKYLSDDATAAVNSTTTYTERNCEAAKGVAITLDGISIENVHKAVDGSVCGTATCNSDCGYAWGRVSIVVEERKHGRVVKTVTALANGRPSRTSTIWSRAKTNPQRGITNYKVIADRSLAAIDNVGTSWVYMLDPRVYAAGNYYVKVTTDLKTNHKDNHIAMLGFHGMKRAVTREMPLKDALFDQSQAETKHKYGSWVVGSFSSESNRLHSFRVHLTVKPR